MKFNVTYASGLKETVYSDLQSVEHFCNTHFGSAWETAKEFGTKVEMVVEGAVEDVQEFFEGAPAEAAPEEAPAEPAAPAIEAVAQSEEPAVETAAPVDDTATTGAVPVPETAPAPQDTAQPV